MKDETIPVSDFTLATFLASQGYVIEYLDRSDPERVQFCFSFDSKESFMEAMNAFWRGETRVEPKQFHNCQKFLKNRLYNEK